MDRPIILLGTHRSGTTWLGRAFSQSPEIAYWPEPRPVWVYRNWFRPDDVLTAVDVTDSIKRYIRQRFASYVRRNGATRFCEKTPSNCLRIPFVHAVFPEARFILILRDGRAVFRSTNEMREAGPGYLRIWQRIRESSIQDYPAHLSRLPWLLAKLRGRPLRFWGPRPPGWRDWLRTDTQNVVVAKQWSATIAAAVRDIQEIPESQRVIIRYEDLVTDPQATFDKMQAVIQLRDPSPVSSFLVKTSDPSRGRKWRDQLSEDLLQEIRPHLEHTLEALGYQW